jgi:hypothetical protein
LYSCDYGQAARYIEDGLALRREIGDTMGIAASLNMLGWANVHQGNYGWADEYFNEGLDVCRQLGDKHIEASMLKGLGYALLLQGEHNYPTVRELFERSLETFRLIGDKVNMIEGLEAFAGLACARTEQPPEAERGAILFGAAEQLRKVMDIPASPPNQRLYEPLKLRARSQLGEVRYDKFLGQGSEMTIDLAIAYALAQQPEK